MHYLKKFLIFYLLEKKVKQNKFKLKYLKTKEQKELEIEKVINQIKNIKFK